MALPMPGSKNQPHQTSPPRFLRTQRVAQGWIKRAETKSKNTWRPLVHIVTKLLPWPILRLTATTGDGASVQKEAKRLLEWKNAGLPVPEVLEIKPEYILIADAGQSLRSWLTKETDPSCRLRVIKLAAQSLGTIHQLGFCHGRPFLKDIVYDGQRIAFIDLEEDPAKVMPLATAQSRDLLLFIMSYTAILNDKHQAVELQAIINSYWTANPSEQVRRELKNNLRLFYWIALPLRLCPKWLLGRDGRHIVRALKDAMWMED